MGRTANSKQKKTQDRTMHNPITIHLLDGDIVEHYKVDSRGYIRTNKRSWVGLKATVLIGDLEAIEGMITTVNEIFSCEVIGGGFISSLGSRYAEKDVTVIIHNRNVD